MQNIDDKVAASDDQRSDQYAVDLVFETAWDVARVRQKSTERDRESNLEMAELRQRENRNDRSDRDLDRVGEMGAVGKFLDAVKHSGVVAHKVTQCVNESAVNATELR